MCTQNGMVTLNYLGKGMCMWAGIYCIPMKWLVHFLQSGDCSRPIFLDTELSTVVTWIGRHLLSRRSVCASELLESFVSTCDFWHPSSSPGYASTLAHLYSSSWPCLPSFGKISFGYIYPHIWSVHFILLPSVTLGAFKLNLRHWFPCP